MPSSIPLGYPLWADGMQWTSLLSRQLDGGVAVWDTNASTTAVHPLGGVFHGPAKPLGIAPLATPGMSVLVNAGYVAVPHPTTGHGVYLFGLLAQGTLTVAANSSGASRTDIVIARVYDLGTTSSYCDVEYITGTPGSGQPATPGVSMLLGAVTVASGATSITSGNITDKRTFTVAPGGILPSTTANAPALAQGQLLWNLSGAGLQTLAPAITYTQPFTESTSWIATFTGLAYVQGIGGDGGGGGGYQDVNGNGSTQGGAAGGGGEWAGDWLHFTEGESYPINIGQGGYRGSGGTNSSGTATLGSNGADGTATTIAGDSSQTLTANAGKGGQGGGTSFPNAGGLGGTGSTAAEHNPGGAGGSGSQVSRSGQGGGSGSRAYGGGGGASGSPGAPGGAGQPGTSSGPGAGGIAGPGGGDGGNGGGAGSNGAPGNAPGGAAGGGYADTSTYYQAGGNGSDGSASITWTEQPASLTAVFTTDSDPVEDLEDINTSTGVSGSSGITAGSGSTYGWGIGYGSTPSEGGYYGWGDYYSGGSGADGQAVPQIQLGFDADGNTDFQIDVKYGITVPEAAVDASPPSLPKGQCKLIVMIDNQVIDTLYLFCGASGGVTRPGDAGAFTVYTSAQFGTTPSSGQHTATLAIETSNTLSGNYSGAHIGNLASVGTSAHPFGGALRSGFTSALTAENCSLRVAGISNSAV